MNKFLDLLIVLTLLSVIAFGYLSYKQFSYMRQDEHSQLEQSTQVLNDIYRSVHNNNNRVKIVPRGTTIWVSKK